MKKKKRIGEKNRLYIVLIDDSVKRIISVGGTLTLKGGYVLKPTDIDPSGRTVRIILLYYGDEMDDAVILAGQTYIYHSSEAALSGLPVIAAHVQDVFSGKELDAMFIDGIFQISGGWIFECGDREVRGRSGRIMIVSFIHFHPALTSPLNTRKLLHEPWKNALQPETSVMTGIPCRC